MKLSGSSKVLILYNEPPQNSGTSVKGVLDQVRVVAEAIKELKIPIRTCGINNLREAKNEIDPEREKIIFNLVEGFEESPETAFFIPALCEALGCSATGSATPSLSLTLDKAKTRGVLSEYGIPIPEGVVVRQGKQMGESMLPMQGPFIVKPSKADASEGIDAQKSVIFSNNALLRKTVKKLGDAFCQDVIVEQLVGTREINVSILENGGNLKALPVAEIDFSSFLPDMPKIVDYAAKWEEDSFAYKNSPRIIPAKLPLELIKKAEKIAIESWYAVGCRDYARVDMRMDDNGNLYVLEVNANPDLSADAGFQAALGAGGISFKKFAEIIISNAEKRSAMGFSAPRKIKRRKNQPNLIRRNLKSGDREKILTLLQNTSAFRNEELEIAMEVLDAEVSNGEKSGYFSIVAEASGEVAGWISYGTAACAVGTWEIFWIAVEPEYQHRGIGLVLLRDAEKKILQSKGRIIVVETSGSSGYNSTRDFYINCGYIQRARIEDFYLPGDDKIFFTKNIKS